MSNSGGGEEQAKTFAWGLLWSLQFVWFVLIGLSYNWPSGGIDDQSPILAISITAVEVVLAVLAILLAVGAVFSYTTFRRDVQISARETAIEEAKKCAKGHLQENGVDLIKESLTDAQFVAELQRKFKEFGIEDSDEASLIDDDSDWEPEKDE